MGITTDVLSTMRGGAAARQADALLKDVVKAVEATGKKGSITIKLDIGKFKGGDTELEIKATLKHSVPVEDIPMGLYYPDKDGSLHREDPRQLEFDDVSGDGKTINLSARRMGVGVTGDDL